MNDVINNSYMAGIAGRNLVLQTLGKVYVKVGDRYYELDFMKNKVASKGDTETAPNLIVINSESDLDNIKYPGEDKVIISRDGNIWTTREGNYEKLDIPFTVTALDELTVNKLKTTSPIEIGGPQAPLVVESTQLIKNLNANLLDGKEIREIALKDNDEVIRGEWKFENDLNVNDINVVGKIKGEGFVIENGKLVVDELEVRNNANLPEMDVRNTIINGTREELWFTGEFKIDSIERLFDYNPMYTNMSIIDNAYFTEYLTNVVYPYLLSNFREGDSDEPIEIPLSFWNDIFIKDFTSNMETGVINYTIRDLMNPTEISYVNTQLSNKKLPDISNFLKVFYAIQPSSTSSAFNGSYYMVKIDQLNNIEYSKLFPNMMIKTGNNIEGIVVDRGIDFVIIRLKNSNDWLDHRNNKIIVVGHQTDSSLKNRSYIASDGYGVIASGKLKWTPDELIMEGNVCAEIKPLTIIKPDGTTIIYNGTEEITIDYRAIE